MQGIRLTHINGFIIIVAIIGLVSKPLYASSNQAEQADDININSTVMNARNYQAQDASKLYPAPKTGMVQHILTLPSLVNEANYMLEIQVGKHTAVDCNKVNLMGEIETLSLAGWGLTYYQVNNVIYGPTTRMMCTEAKTNKFITLNQSVTLSYDSRQPKVFYLPEGTELRYRIWKAVSQFKFSSH
ncbi:serine protease inhibitor ecotin [Shewanella sp. A14]